jgi:hypothetical protein
MKNQLKVLGLFIILLVVSSCKTETHSNPVTIEDVDTTEELVNDLEEAAISGDELKGKIVGSWSSNAQPGQVDFNEDGTYKSCEYYNTTAVDEEKESCLNGAWTIDDDKVVIIMAEGDTITNSVTWVFDNVVYLGIDDVIVNNELAWESGMTKL